MQITIDYNSLPKRMRRSLFSQIAGPTCLILGLILLSFTMTYAQEKENLALGKPARQSTETSYGTPASKAVNGETTGVWGSRTNNDITHTNVQTNPWWEVDLGSVQDIGEIVVWNRIDACCWSRLQNFYVMVSEEPITETSTTEHQFGEGPMMFTTVDHPSMTINGYARGRYVRVFIEGDEKILSLSEVQVYAGTPPPSGQNHALLLDGVGSFVDCGDFLTPSYTKEVWIKLDVDNLKANNNIISGKSGHAFRILSGRADAGQSGSWTQVQDPNPIEAGWQHYAVTYDDSTQMMTLYRNGVAVSEKVGVAPQSATSVQLGQYASCCQFRGMMDEVRIWDHARDAADIANDYAQALTGTESGLLAHYNFNQGVADGDNTGITTLNDLTGNNDGTLRSFALTSGSNSNFVASDLSLGGDSAQPEVSADAEEFSPELNSETSRVTYQLPMTSEPSVITIEKVGDHAVFEGDIVLYELGGPEDPESGISNDAGMISAIGQHDYRWAKGEIPYVIADQHPKTADILAAIEKLNAQSVLNIRPKRTTDTDYVYIENPSSGCWSVVGRKGGRQRMGVSNRCSVGNVMHEFLHAAGMYHEQSRADRDQFLTIDFSNIKEDKKGNFHERESKSVCDFDFGSIMQYPSHAFAKDRSKPTIIPLEPLPEGVVMGQRSQLSECDKMGILNLYKTISPQAKPYEPYWFTDVFQRSSYRVQGNIYNTGEDWDWTARSAPKDESLSEFYLNYFDFQKEVMNDFKVTDFTFEDCKIKIKGTSSKQYLFDVRYGRADLYNQWYDGQYGAISRPTSGGGYELSFETTLSNCNSDPDHTYFVVLVVKNYDDQTGYLIAEAPMAIRYAHPDSDD